MESFLHLTDGTIYTFRNKWNGNLVLHLDDDNFTVAARPFVNSSPNQHWRAHTADSNHFHLQNMYTGGYLKYTFSNTSAFCSDTAVGFSVWALQNFFSSTGTVLTELISENGNTVFIPYCNTIVTDHCPIQTGPVISDTNHAWIFQPVG